MSETFSARILIVDDEAAQLKALCDTLTDHGFATVGFKSAREALNAVTTRPFDLLLTDLSMPGMDGIALFKAAREIDSNLIGIMMTGHGSIDTAVEAMKAGALDYILKPFKMSAILPVLSRALSVRRLRLENEELQRRVLARTTELEAANKELEAFSHSVSHDLSAPLRGIRNYANILSEDFGATLPADAQVLIRKISRGSERMGQLIHDLLEFSRFSRKPLTQQTVCVSNQVQEIVAGLKKESVERRVDVQVGVLPDCTGDASLLEQVWVNLLSNAFKFTRHQKEARIEIGSREEESGTVYFVRDNGAGFNMKYADRLFGVFQRMHLQDEFEGTGIGLSIVQRIVQRHGGRIWAESEVGKGASFYFTLGG